LPNGNTFITEGPTGHFYEIDTTQTTVWEYSIGMGECTKAIRYGCDYSGLAGLNLDCNCDIDGTAFYDDCDDCVGGNTGLDPCVDGIENVNQTNGISIYPNPSNGIFHINSTQLDNVNYVINVYNMTGQNVKQLSNTKDVNISSLNNGIYYIEIISENSTVTLKKKISLIK
jgi:hypothetical protein